MNILGLELIHIIEIIVISTALISLINFYYKHRKKYELLEQRIKMLEEGSAAIILLNNALISVLKDRLVHAYRYHISNGYMSLIDKNNVDSLYINYKRLVGHDGTVDDIYKQLMSLRIVTTYGGVEINDD